MWVSQGGRIYYIYNGLNCYILRQTCRQEKKMATKQNIRNRQIVFADPYIGYFMENVYYAKAYGFQHLCTKIS